ncbi:MAG: right-handed parallel beta-helix repeat-containing protein [Kiritimatiellia bacterium]
MHNGVFLFLAAAVQILPVLTLPVRADTSVGGTIGSGTWDPSNNNYIVTGNITVGSDATLTIKPGVKVLFNADKYMEIQGELIARGNETNGILFAPNASKPYSGTDRWGYILFSSTAKDAVFDGANYSTGCIIEYATVEYAGSLATENGAISVENSSPYLSHCIIRNSAKAGVYAQGADGMRLFANAVSNNVSSIGGLGGGIHMDSSFQIAMTSNTVSSNSALRGGGIRLETCDSAYLEENEVTRNRASDTGATGGGGGIHLRASTNVTVTNNTVRNNNALSIDYGGGGIWIWDCAGCRFTDNTIASNTAAADGGGICVFYYSDSVIFRNNSISGNTAAKGGGIAVLSSSDIEMTGDLISSNTAASGGGIYLGGGHRAVLSADRVDPVWLLSNSTYQVYNANTFDSVTNPGDNGNVDARNIWWGARDEGIIQSNIYDYYDNTNRGVVFYDPFTVFSLTVNTNGGGTVSNDPGKAFYDPADIVNLTASPSNYWYFSAWSNDIAGTNLFTNILITGNMIVNAGFYYPVVTNGVPVGWLIEHGLGTNDAAAIDDEDGDFSLNWEEYYAGTVPTNDSSVLSISSVLPTGTNMEVRWQSVSNRYYTIEKCSNLLNAGWDPVTNRIRGTEPLNTLTVGTSSARSFYRIKVE